MKLISLLNSRLKVAVSDGRSFVGSLLAFDRHLNLVLSDTEEFRPTKKTLAKRSLGLVILRGDLIVSISVESHAPAAPAAPSASVPTTGVAKPAGRGMPPAALAAPVRGIGGPAPQAMAPHHGPAAPFGRGFPFPPPGFRPPMPMPPPGFRPPMPVPPGFIPPAMPPNMPPPGMQPPNMQPPRQ